MSKRTDAVEEVILQYAYKSEQSRQIKTNMRYKIARTLDKIEKGEIE